MPELKHPTSGDVINLPAGATYDEAVGMGYRPVDPDAPVRTVTPGGRQRQIRAGDLGYAQKRQGVEAADPAALLEKDYAQFQEDELQAEHGGFGSQVTAFGEGIADIGTFGGYSALNELLGGSAQERAQANPAARGLGEGVGLIGSAFVAPGAGALGKAARIMPSGKTGAWAARGQGVRGLAARTAAEGAAYGGLNNFFDAIENKELTAEALVADTLKESLIGSALGGGGALVFGSLGRMGEKYLKSAEEADNLARLAGQEQANKAYKTLGRSSSRFMDAAEEAELAALRLDPVRRAENRLGHAEARFFSGAAADADDLYKSVQQELKTVRGAVEITPQEVDPAARTVLTDSFLADTKAMEELALAAGVDRNSTRWTDIHLALDELKDGALRGSSITSQTESAKKLSTQMGSLVKAKPELIDDYNATLKRLVEGKAALAEFTPDAVRKYDLARLSEMEAELGKAQRFYKELGGLSPKNIENRIKNMSAGRYAKYADDIENYAVSLRNMADELGIPVQQNVLQSLEQIGPTLRTLKARPGIPLPGTPPVDSSQLAAARQRVMQAFGVEEGAITSGHWSRYYTLDDKARVEGARALSDYMDEVEDFAKRSGNSRLEKSVKDYRGELREEYSKLFGGAPAEGPGSMKEVLATVAGVEMLDDLGLPDEMKWMVYGGILKRHLGKAPKQGGRGPLLSRLKNRMVTRGAVYGASNLPRGAGAAASGFGRGALAGGAWTAVDQIMAGRGAQHLVVENQDRVRRAVARAVSKSAPKAAKAHIGIQWIRRSSFDVTEVEGNERKKYKSDVEAFQDRARELARFNIDPSGTKTAIQERLAPVYGLNEELGQRATDKAFAVGSYLGQYAPKDPGSVYAFGKSNWRPGELELYAFAERMRGAMAPMDTIIAAIESGEITPEAAHAVRTLWPEMLRDTQVALLEEVERLGDKMPYSRIVSTSLLYDTAFHHTMRPEFRQFMQDFQMKKYEALKQPVAPGGGSGATDDNGGYTKLQEMMG